MIDPVVYLVRVWRREESFRASVRRVAEERVHLFNTPDDVARFIAAPEAVPPPPSDSS